MLFIREFGRGNFRECADWRGRAEPFKEIFFGGDAYAIGSSAHK